MFSALKRWLTKTTARIVVFTVVVTAVVTLAVSHVGMRTYRAFVTLHRVAAQSDADRVRLDQVIQFLNSQIDSTKTPNK